jgi:hypothetical protein
MKTGNYSVERILFYKSGRIRCLFPLDGKITGYWTEEDEYELAEKWSFNLKCGKMTNKIINIRFYETEAIKSITFWSEEKAIVKTLNQKMKIRIGLSLYPDGSLESCEPLSPTLVQTPIGDIMAYDCNALGINGDVNSLNFYQSGKIKSLQTSTDIIEIKDKNGTITTIKPGLEPHLFNNEVKMTVPIQIQFKGDFVTFSVFEEKTYKISDYEFIIKNSEESIKSQCVSC